MQFTSVRYRKPLEVCKVDAALEKVVSTEETMQFIKEGKKAFEDFVHEQGLHVRKATYDDIEGIFEYAKDRFRVLWGSTVVYSSYWLDHMISCGNPMLLMDANGKIRGYKFEATYLDEERSSCGGGMAVDADLSGQHLGRRLFDYISLLAMEKGARVKRGIMPALNYASVHNILNAAGAVFVAVLPNLPGLGQRFVYKIELTPAGMSNNEIDRTKLLKYLETKTKGIDYELVACADAEGILKMYTDTDFRVMAMLREGQPFAEQMYVAMPKHILLTPE